MKITLYSDKNDLITKLNSIAVALMIAASCITAVLARISFFSKLQNNVIVLGAVCIFIFTALLITKRLFIPIPALITMFFTFITYMFTLLINPEQCDLSAIQYIFYAVIPIFVIGQKIEGEYVMRYVLYISLITMPMVNSFFNIQYEQYAQAYMGNVYSLITSVTIAMIHFKLYRKQSNILVKISYIYNLYLLVQMLLYGNRGAVLCIIFCLIVLTINSYDETGLKPLPPLKIVIIVVVGIAVLIAVINALPLLEAFSSFLGNTFHNVPSFILKMIKYMSDGDATNGRETISSFTTNAIFEKPIFGNGIKTFEAYVKSKTTFNWPYPHNYILQYLFEYGIVFGLMPIYLSLSLAVKTVFARIKEKKEFAICCTLVCLNIPKLFVSTDPWSSTTIWMLITYSLIYIVNNNKYFSAYKNRLHKKATEDK